MLRVRSIRLAPDIKMFTVQYETFLGREINRDRLKSKNLFGLFGSKGEMLAGFAVARGPQLDAITGVPEDGVYALSEIVGDLKHAVESECSWISSEYRHNSFVADTLWHATLIELVRMPAKYVVYRTKSAAQYREKLRAGMRLVWDGPTSRGLSYLLVYRREEALQLARQSFYPASATQLRVNSWQRQG